MPRILVTPRSLTTHPNPVVARLRDGGFDIVSSTANVLPGKAHIAGVTDESVVTEAASANPLESLKA